jgi:hypothetical protein
MALRAFALLAVLVLPSLAGAAEGLFHLCRGSPRLWWSCCCDKQASQQPPHAQPQTTGARQGCCGELTAQRPSEPTATAATERHHEAPRLVALLHTPSAVPPTAEVFILSWVRLGGVHRSTAPPLYIQNCSYLI